MYLKTKKQVLSLMDTLKEAVQYMKTHPEEAGEYLGPCLQARELIVDILSDESESLQEKFLELQGYFEKILHEEQTLEEWCSLLKNLLDVLQICRKMVKELVPRLKVFFLPYKAEMWTALESIWQAFSMDPLCDTYVMPIPYHTLKFTKNGQIVNDRFCYEADKYPQEVPVINYAQIDLEKEQPDAIFIHNPYDECNNLTRVLEKYYARNLREVTNMLVYSPYFTVSGFDPKTQSALLITPALKYAHRTIVQSEKLAKIYQSYGISRDKLLVCGSPKIDALVHGLKNMDCVPKEWKKKIDGKTVFLMNTHMSFFMIATDAQQERLDDITNLFKKIGENESYALIWRPHPLMLSMIRSRGEMKLCAQLEQLIKKAEQMNCVIIDRCSSYLPSFNVSHAMLSTYSSLVTEYMVTGKPTCFLDIRYIKWGPYSNEIICKNGPISLENNYFPSDFELFFKDYDKEKSNGWELCVEAYRSSYGKFMHMVHCGDDEKKLQRMKDIKKGFIHVDGTCGEAVYYSIMRTLQENI